MDAQSNASEAALDKAGGNALASCKRSTLRSPGSGAFATCGKAGAVGLFDIRKRYRRSVLGPFWITISLGAFILGLGFI